MNAPCILAWRGTSVASQRVLILLDTLSRPRQLPAVARCALAPVASWSICMASESMTTPKSCSASSIVVNPSRTSERTSAGSRSSGSPYPPELGTVISSVSPAFRSWPVIFEAQDSSSGWPAFQCCSCRACPQRFAAGSVGIEKHLSAEKASVRSQPSEEELGVRGCWFGTTTAVARRSGICAGRLGPDPENAALVYIGDRAATCTDRLDVDHRHHCLIVADFRIEEMAHAKLTVRGNPDVG